MKTAQISAWDKNCLGCVTEGADIMLEVKEDKDIFQIFMTNDEALSLRYELGEALTKNGFGHLLNQ